jgi:glucose/arabinose dehydrogenase
MMGSVRRFWIAMTLLAAGACGSSTPPVPSPGPGPGNSQSITGRERIGWDQPAETASELATFRYAIYVDGIRSVVAESSCANTAAPGGFACSGRLPPMSNGSHTLELAAFVDGDGEIVESARSPSMTVSVSALTAESASDWASGLTGTTRDGLTLRADKVAEGLHLPVDAAFAPDGRLFIAERAGRVRVVAGGQLQEPDALVLLNTDDEPDLAILSIAVDPDFARTQYLFVVHSAESREGPVVRLSRYREAGGRLGQRAVLFQTAAPPATRAAAVVRFGPDRKLYVAVNGDGGNGRLFRLGADGTLPRDQAGSTPAIAGGVEDPRGLGWDPESGLLWIADEAGEAAHISGLALSAPPIRAVVRGRATLQGGVGQLAFYTSDAIAGLRNEALIASTEGHILRLRFGSDDPTRMERAGRLLENQVGPIRVVTVGPDGAIYFCTNDALGRLAEVR